MYTQEGVTVLIKRAQWSIVSHVEVMYIYEALHIIFIIDIIYLL